MVIIRTNDDLLKHMQLHDSDIGICNLSYIIIAGNTIDILNTSEELTFPDTVFYDVKYCYYCGKKFRKCE